MTKKPKATPPIKPSDEVLKASFNAGFADGRLDAIEESMDAVADLIFKVEAMIAALGEQPEPATLDQANHTLRALHVAFAAVTGSTSGSNAFTELLDESRQRALMRDTATRH